MRHLWVLPLWLGIMALTVGADERGEVRGWLGKMSQAVKSQNYQGVFVYLHDAQLEAMHILHTVDGEHEQERLISLNGAAREVLRDNDAVTCIMPDSQRVSVGKRHRHKPFPAVLPLDLDGLSRYYSFHALGRDRVADRLVKVVAIIPRDGYRYGYRLFLDEKTALPLKSDLMDETGSPVAQIMFTSLQVGPELRASPLARKAASLSKGFRKVIRDPETNGVGQSRWRFKSLPAGFDLIADNRWSRSSDGTQVEHLVLSDGLASLSVYIERAGNSAEALKGGARMGAVNAWGQVVMGYQVTAVGEVPERTVREVVGYLEPVNGD